MTTMVAHSRLTPQPCTLSRTELADIARTFEEAPHPVWIHDLSGRCVYRNLAASHTAPDAHLDAVHDILDHEDRRIGRLHLRMD